MFSIGSHELVYNPAKGAGQASYRPWLFAYIKSESHTNLRDLLMPALLALIQSQSAPLDC